MKSLHKILRIGCIAALLTITAAGTLCGASVTVLREGPPESGRENAFIQDSASSDENQLRFAPQRLRSKPESGTASDAENRPVKMERYQPYQEGVGERKTRR
ncbi:MAG: hypothetical protein AB1558_09355 [Thermodesulfobacteriota bacterium]